MTSVEDGEINAVGNKLPYTQQDWWDKRRATDTVLEEVGGDRHSRRRRDGRRDVVAV